MKHINSIGRVELCLPTTGSATVVGLGPGSAPSLAEIEAAFIEWMREARRRGCPENAPVIHDQRSPFVTLAVMWDAAPPTRTEC